MKIETNAVTPGEPADGWVSADPAVLVSCDLNERSDRTPRTVQVPCGCLGRNPGCVNCLGTGQNHKRACQRCGGTGLTGGQCVDCRGIGWREIDQAGSA